MIKFEELSRTTRVLIAFGFVAFLISIGLFIGLLFKSNNELTEKIERVDLLASCYKGCQFATQPIYEITPIQDKNTRIELYDRCSYLCEERYDYEDYK